jgi:hypothetical protein
MALRCADEVVRWVAVACFGWLVVAEEGVFVGSAEGCGFGSGSRVWLRTWLCRVCALGTWLGSDGLRA